MTKKVERLMANDELIVLLCTLFVPGMLKDYVTIMLKDQLAE